MIDQKNRNSVNKNEKGVNTHRMEVENDAA